MSIQSGTPLITVVPTTLPAIRTRALVFQLLLVSAAVVLPAVSHWFDFPVRWLLPMHWPVILAGLVYGPVGGSVVGLLSPPVSFALSGMPPVTSLPVMMIELCAYGLVTGLLRGTFRWNTYAGIAIALIVGRILAMGITLLFGAPATAVVFAYAKGLPAGLAQVALLPVVAKWWVDRERNGEDADLDGGRGFDGQ